MAYETSTLNLLPAGTVCAAGALTAPSATYQYGGSDFDKGVIRIPVSAVSGATALAICLQDSPDGGTTWYPSIAAASDMTGAPGYATMTPVASKNFEVPLNAFPGNLFRVALWATGGTVTCGVSADLAKRVPDNS